MRLILTKRILPLILLTLALNNCGGNVPPQLQPQVDSLQILQRLNEFQDVVVDGYANGSITPSHALLYSKYVVSATKTVKTLPTGWQATLKMGWSELEKQIPLASMEPKVQVTAKLIDALMAAL